MRLFKLFRVAPKRLAGRTLGGTQNNMSNNMSSSGNEKKEKEKPTKVGQVFSELATCRVILIVYII